jgi:CubicO group peptidase (beta-lactamase class C family)
MTASMIEATGLDEATVTAWIDAVWGPGSIMARAAQLGGAFADPGRFETRAWHATEISLYANAHALARMYAATVSDVDGVRLLDPETVERMIEVQTDKTRMHGLPPGLDVPADRSFYMSLGFWRARPSSLPWVGPGSFGHPGSGGSVGFGDLDARVGFGYIMNLWSFRVGVRAKNLAAAVVSCLG